MSFDRFWNVHAGHCFDVIDGPRGNDPALRPNQLFLLSLHFRPFDRARELAILDACSRVLLRFVRTPFAFAARSRVRRNLRRRPSRSRRGLPSRNGVGMAPRPLRAGDAARARRRRRRAPAARAARRPPARLRLGIDRARSSTATRRSRRAAASRRRGASPSACAPSCGSLPPAPRRKPHPRPPSRPS